MLANRLIGSETDGAVALNAPGSTALLMPPADVSVWNGVELHYASGGADAGRQVNEKPASTASR